MTVLVESIPTMGKTYLSRRENCLDMDSNRYRKYFKEHYLLPPKERPKIRDGNDNPDWFENYKNEIVKQSKFFDVITVTAVASGDKSQFDAWLKKHNLDYRIALPEYNSIDGLLEIITLRARERGSTEQGIAFVREHLPLWLKGYQELDYPKISIKKGEYLEDALVRVGILK